MKKYLPLILGAAGIAAVVYFLRSRPAAPVGGVYGGNVKATTGTASPFESFSNLVGLIRGTGGPVNTAQPDRTGAIITASGQVIKQLPDLFSSIGSIFKRNQVPAVVNANPSPVPAADDWSNMSGDYWANRSWDYPDWDY